MVAIYNSNVQSSQFESIKNTQMNDMFDLDITIVAQARQEKGEPGEGMPMITSRSLCTPGCAPTGTYNSFCC